MKRLIDYICELRDETYFKVARKRNEQGKDISDIISHANERITKDFIKELTSSDWYKTYVKKIEYSDDSSTIKLLLSEQMRDEYGADPKYENERQEMYDNLKTLARKYGRLIHGLRFMNCYANEEPTILFYLLDRKKYLKDINKDTILYHVTSKLENANKIIENGIIVSQPIFTTYTYKCVFAFKSKRFIDMFSKKFLKKKQYYVIEFKAGDNIYFDDWMLNSELITELQYKSPGGNMDSIRKRASQAIFTLSNIDKEQIVSVTEINGKNNNVIYSKD